MAEPEVARHMIILPSMDTLLCLVSGKNALGPALNIPVEAGARAWGVTKMRLCHLKTGQVRCNGEGREGGRESGSEGVRRGRTEGWERREGRAVHDTRVCVCVFGRYVRRVYWGCPHLPYV